MRVLHALSAAVAAIALSGCQTTGSGKAFVNRTPGPAFDAASSECRAQADKAFHRVGGIGVLSLFATIAATTSKKIHAYDDCMAAKGYRTAEAPDARRSAAQPAAQKPTAVAKPTKAARPS